MSAIVKTDAPRRDTMGGARKCVLCHKNGRTRYLNYKEIEWCEKHEIQDVCTEHVRDFLARHRQQGSQTPVLRISAKRRPDELSIHGAAKLLGLPWSFVLREIAEPEVIPSRRLGDAKGSLVVREADVNALREAALACEPTVPEVVAYMIRMRTRAQEKGAAS